ncbi:Uncharacterised protein [Escherichia coli]|uniref:Uncharacterized protein n=1 Tax=Escherichia coli TaxID=562 RepID=A0A377ART1_ECOLX|nr:Uncharacterised protein [Escherichia coli]
MELIARGSDFSGSWFPQLLYLPAQSHESENRYLESGKEAT